MDNNNEEKKNSATNHENNTNNILQFQKTTHLMTNVTTNTA